MRITYRDGRSETFIACRQVQFTGDKRALVINLWGDPIREREASEIAQVECLD